MTPPGSAAAGSEDGFTVVEMLVAFAVAALCTVTALQIAASLSRQGAGVETALRTADEAPGLVWLRFAQGRLQPGQESGRFSDGSPWVLTVADVAPVLGWRDVPPVWHLRLTRDDPRGPIVYETILTAGLGG